MSAHNINHYLTRCRMQLQCCMNNLSVSCFKCLILNHGATTGHLEMITVFAYISGGTYLPHKYAVCDSFNTEYLILHFVKYSNICNVATVHAMKAYKGRVGTVTHSFLTSAPDEMSGHPHAPASLSPGKVPWYQWNRRLQ